jgi:hypothetical protein
MMMASYTWSKSLGRLHYRQIFSQTQTQAQNNYDLSDAKSLLAFDQPHMVNILNSFDLPIGRGRKLFGSANRAVDAFIGGWTLGVITPLCFGWSARHRGAEHPECWYLVYPVQEGQPEQRGTDSDGN